MKKLKSEIEDMWFFWNNSFLNRIHPRRRLKLQGNYSDMVECDKCGKEVPFSDAKRYRYRPNKQPGLKKSFLCQVCYEKHLVEFRERKKEKMKHTVWDLSAERRLRFEESVKSIEKFDDLMTNCRYGTCDILAAHRELLKDDDNRLRTDFMLELICGKEKARSYRKGRGDQGAGHGNV